MSDRLIGVLFALVALAVFWVTLSIPSTPGQEFGAALYPRSVSIGLAFVSALLIISCKEKVSQPTPQQGHWGLGAVFTVGGLVFYIVSVDTLGFIICSIIILSALLWIYKTKSLIIIPIAVFGALLIHTIFYKFLHVPLPWGLLAPVAW